MNELLTVPEAADLLRTTKQGVYDRIHRGQMPGVVKVGRRVLIRQADLRKSLGLSSVAPSNDSALKSG